MGKIIFFLLITITLFLPNSGLAAAFDMIKGDSFIISYIISLHGQDKGYMEIKVNNDQFRSEYFNITSNDRIPFFARSKTGVLKDKMYASKLGFNNKKYEVYYDLKKHAPKNLPEFLNPEKSNDKRSVLVNQATGRVELAFEKMPMVAFENIILGFLSGTIRSGTPMMMFEGANNLKMKIYFEKENSESPTECVDRKYACYRQNIPGQSPKFLFNVFINEDGIPVKVASRSRWEFKVDKIGEMKQERTDIKPYLLKKAKKQTKWIFSDSRAKIESIEINNFSYIKEKSYRYDYDVKVQFLPGVNPAEEAVKHLCRSVGSESACSGDPRVVTETEKHYSVCAGKKDLCQALRGIWGYQNCEYIEAKDSIKVSREELINIVREEMGKESIDLVASSWYSFEDCYVVDIETGEKIDKSIEEICRQYLSKKYPDRNLDFKTYEIVTMKEESRDRDKEGSASKEASKKPASVIINYEEKRSIPDYKLIQAAKYSIYQKLYNRRIGSLKFLNNYNMELDRSEKDNREYCLSVPKKKITDIIREKRKREFRKAEARADKIRRAEIYKNGFYNLGGVDNINMEAIDDLVMEDLTQKYPRLGHAKNEIRKQGTYWVFSVISSEVNICR